MYELLKMKVMVQDDRLGSIPDGKQRTNKQMPGVFLNVLRAHMEGRT